MRFAVAAVSSFLIVACGSTPPPQAVPADGGPSIDGGVAVDGGAGQDGGTTDGGAVQDGGAQACTTDPGCGTDKVCESGVCINACSAQNTCPGGFAQACVDGHCRPRCLNDGNCNGGEICEAFICSPPQCSPQSPCSGTNMRCNGGRCESFTSCGTNNPCPVNFTCQMEVCEELPTCLGDGNCEAGNICEDGHCKPATACTTEGECTAAQDCVGGLCVPAVCRGNGDCQSPKICSGGACVDPGNTQLVFKVVILTPGGLIRPAQTRPLVAIALDQNDRAVEGVQFQWSSNHPEFASVDQTTGLLQGGDQAGTAAITAKAQGTSVTSAAVEFTNLLAPAEGKLRITLIDRRSGASVTGAKLLLAGQVHDVSGTYVQDAPTGAVDFTVFHPAYDYVTVVGTSARDIVLPLTPRSRLDPAAGLTGKIDLSQVSTTGGVRIGVSGLSSGRPLTDFDLQRLFGDTFQSEVTIPTVGSFAIPVPGGITLAAEIIAGVSIDVKGDYYIQGDPGLRAAWSLGGRVDLAEVGGLFGGGGGGGGAGGVIRQLLPLFERFDHGVVPALTLQSLPLVVDAQDIDGDGDMTEKVPDWGNFRHVTLKPSQAQTLRTEVRLPTLPSQGGTPVDGAILNVGVLVPGVGLVTLGLGGAFDDNGDGVVPPAIVKSAPVHGGLGVGRYALIALASALGQGNNLPDTFSGRTATWEQLPTRIDVGPFLPFIEGAKFNPGTRQLQAGAVAGTHLVRAVIQSPAGAWEVYAPAGTLSTTLPALPAGVTEDLAADAEARVEAIALTGGGTLDDVLGNASLGLAQINRLMEAFSRAPAPAP